MSVNLKKPLKKDILPVPGFSFLTFNAKVKEKSKKNDFLIFELNDKASTAAVFTKNKFCAAPVILAKQNLTKINPRLLVINSGNANAGTGKNGIVDAKKINLLLSSKFNVNPNSILPFSTGVILQPLPMQRITQAIKDNCSKQIKYNSHWIEAAEAIMTTDTIPKAISQKFFLGKHEITCTGIAKGSGMINPNMATMLGFIFLDANISKKMLNCLIHEVVERTFNLITVDGDTSTNDSFLISCSNLAKNKLIETKNSLYIQLRNNLMDIAGQLAEMIIRDGEGATKFIRIEIKNAKNIDEVKIAGKAIANSPLVKTAFFASDPNLGRILSALGNISAFNINTNLIDIKLNNDFVVQKGKIAPSYSESKALKAMKAKEFMLSINLKRGKTSATVLTTDLSYEYIKINAEYRT